MFASLRHTVDNVSRLGIPSVTGAPLSSGAVRGTDKFKRAEPRLELDLSDMTQAVGWLFNAEGFVMWSSTSGFPLDNLCPTRHENTNTESYLTEVLDSEQHQKYAPLDSVGLQ